MSDYLEQIKRALVDGKHTEIETLLKQALDARLEVDNLINEGLIPAMDIVGQNFSEGKIFVPEMLVSAMTMKKALGVLKPRMERMPSKSKGKILIATVQGDLHDIGKNLVAMMLEGAGFEVIDLGVNVSLERIIEEVTSSNPKILALSSLLTTTMPEMRSIVSMLAEKGLRDRVRVMVGGAPVDAKFADSIGADGFGKDAGEAVALARKLVG
ncbi:MAG: hypothetical protein A3J94_03680 [Syntrophus sp. RIFOXYC2_FULL_54_9]|nr:MAG: hypothetical protein A3J94_03680 [Syntrophus sp. RIFOXYC2_FULL_54_9]HBB17566.1 cobalamin-binding protein [Syntrophus sp. (in: bacteria)]